MGRLKRHLDHILNEVVPARGAAQAGMDERYLAEIDARTQPPHLVRGLEQWNGGRLYEQHETLEWLWRATPDPVRDAIKGIIQSGVGGFHVLRGNRRGALGKWTGAIGYLEPFDGRHPYGIDIGHLRAQVLEARQALLEDEGEPPDWEAHRNRVRRMAVRWLPRPAAPRVTALLRRVDRVWQDGPLAVEAIIDGLTETEADWTPPGADRSIRSLLAHLASGKIAATARCFGDEAVAEVDPEPPAEWRKFRRWLTEAYETLREPLGFLADGDLDAYRTTPDGERTVQMIIMGTIEQDLFYAGEINLLRSLFAARADNE